MPLARSDAGFSPEADSISSAIRTYSLTGDDAMFVNAAPFSTAGINDYRELVGTDAVERIRAKAEPLQGLKVLHVNATKLGGGVAEILYSLIPLMRDAGLDVDWYVLDEVDGFFDVTKTFHNALQGQAVRWSPKLLEVYRQGNEANAHNLADRVGDYDVVVVHDPQPLALAELLPASGAWIWRCHIDTTAPNPLAWDALSPFLENYDLAVFSTPEYVPAGLGVDSATALPCIDPFRPKNMSLETSYVREVLRKYGVDATRPYMLQVSRFDPWKDPLGVLEAYRGVKRIRPEIQLVYMASMATDDPEGHGVYHEVKTAAAGDPDVHLLAMSVPLSAVNLNAKEVNAMQLGSRIVLQKSIREGFGLTVAEALWKEKPVIGGNVGGIRYQIRDGWNGYLVSSVDECVERCTDLLEHPEEARDLGRRGRETVRENFLFTRLLDQYLDWFARLAAGAAAPVSRAAAARNGRGRREPRATTSSET